MIRPMNVVHTSPEKEAKHKELAAVIRDIMVHSETCRLELHFKDGQLSSGSKFHPILK